MLDRSHGEIFLALVAIATLNWYPDKADNEPGYTIDEDIDWCLHALPHSDIPLDGLRQRIEEVITDPTTHRQPFVRDILALTATL